MCIKCKFKSKKTIPNTENDGNNTVVEVTQEFTAPTRTETLFNNRWFFYNDERGAFWISLLGQILLIVHFSARA